MDLGAPEKLLTLRDLFYFGGVFLSIIIGGYATHRKIMGDLQKMFYPLLSGEHLEKKVIGLEDYLKLIPTIMVEVGKVGVQMKDVDKRLDNVSDRLDDLINREKRRE